MPVFPRSEFFVKLVSGTLGVSFIPMTIETPAFSVDIIISFESIYKLSGCGKGQIVWKSVLETAFMWVINIDKYIA